MNDNTKTVSLVKVSSADVKSLKEAVSTLLSNLNVPADFLRREKVLLKPNLVIPAAGDSPIITKPNLVIAVAKLFMERGAKEVIIAEGSLISADTDQAFKKSGLQKLADSIGVRCVNLKKEEMVKVKINPPLSPFSKGGINLSPPFSKGGQGGILDEIEIPKLLSEYKIINLPKLKTHIQTKLSCAVKNLKGVLSDATKRRVHFVGLNQGIVDFSRYVNPTLNIVDAIVAMEGMGAISGTAVDMNLIFGGIDPFCVDTVACELIGYKSGDVEYMNIARSIGMAPSGIGDIILVGDDINNFKRDFVKPSGLLPEISIISFEDADACSACIHTISSFMDARQSELTQIERILNKRGEIIKILLGPNIKEEALKGDAKPIFFGKCTKAACDQFSGKSAFVPGCPPAMSEDLFKKLIPLYGIDEKKLKGSFFGKIRKKMKILGI